MVPYMLGRLAHRYRSPWLVRLVRNWTKDDGIANFVSLVDPFIDGTNSRIGGLLQTVW